MKKEYDIKEMAHKLQGHNIDISGGSDKRITISGNIGIKTWGIIDFLCNYHGYKWSRVYAKTNKRSSI